MRNRKNVLKGICIFLVALLMVSSVTILGDTTSNQTISSSTISSEGGEGYKDLKIIDVQGGFGKISAEIKNNGTMDADDVEWMISVKGGLFGFLNVETTGIIPVISVGASATIETDKFIYGLGQVNISIEATYVDSYGTGFVLGPFLLNIQTSVVPVVMPWKFSAKGLFQCTLHMECNDWAVWITRVEWTKDGDPILAKDFNSFYGAGGKGHNFDLPVMYPPEEPNDFTMYWKAVKGGTFNDVIQDDVPYQAPFKVTTANFKWYQPYPTNPK